MTDRKSLAIILGAVMGIAAVGATVAVYVRRQHGSAVKDINEIFDQARRTVRKLDEAVEILRKSAA